MAGYDGNGNWTSDLEPIQDRDDGIAILASKFDALIQTNLVASFENCLTTDQQTLLQADFNFNNFKAINQAAGTEQTDTPNLAQVVEKDLSSDVIYPLKTVFTGTEWIYVDDNGTPYKMTLDTLSKYSDGYIKGGVLSNNSGDPLTVIDISSVKARSDDDTIDFNLTADSLDVTLNASWASGVAPTLTDLSVFVWADYNSGTPRYILDNVSGSFIAGAKRLVGAFLLNGSDEIIEFTANEKTGGSIETTYRNKILDVTTWTNAYVEKVLSIPDIEGLKVKLQNRIEDGPPATATNTSVSADGTNANFDFWAENTGADSSVYDLYLEDNISIYVKVTNDTGLSVKNIYTLGYTLERI